MPSTPNGKEGGVSYFCFKGGHMYASGKRGCSFILLLKKSRVGGGLGAQRRHL